MLKNILILSLFLSFANAQSNKEIFQQILNNNKEIKAYKQYLNSVNIENQTDLLPLNPNIEFSFLSGSNQAIGNKQELIISQPFEFPTKYFVKSDIAELQRATNQFNLRKFEINILEKVQSLLIDMIYLNKKVNELTKRFDLAEKMLKTVQTRIDKGDVGIMELNKAKSNLASSKTKLNLAKIDLNSTLSELRNINGGEQLNINSNDYWNSEIELNFDSLYNLISKADNNIKSFEQDKKLFEKKLSLATYGWFPSFDIGYRQENESNFSYNGVRFQMSLPIFENQNKVPKAESELYLLDLEIQSYSSKFYIEKKRLFDKFIQLRSSLLEQKELMDYSQLDLNAKSYELGHISLTQYYMDNTMYYEVFDLILDIELEYQKTLAELLIELNYDEIQQ